MNDVRRSLERISGCEIAVARSGAGEPLLFLHGAQGAASWAPFMARLAEHFDLIVPEHPGFGRSATPDWLDNVGDLAYFYLKAKGSITGGPQSIDDLMDRGMFLCGSADTVTQQIETYQREIGFGHLLVLQFATLPADLTRRSAALFATKVMPKLRHLAEPAPIPASA